METKIALVGNPNCGKTTVFNGLTGSNQRIGNWPGVTVERKEGFYETKNTKYQVIDLPGIYSLNSHSEDERVSRDFLLFENYDLIVNIIDSSNIERNLYLTTQLIENKRPFILLFNMIDLAEKKGLNIDIKGIETNLGVPCFSIDGTKRNSYKNLKDFIDEVINENKVCYSKIDYPNEIEDYIEKKYDLVEKHKSTKVDSRAIILKALEEDSFIKEYELELLNNYLQENEIDAINNILGDKPDIILADYRYGFIHSISSKYIKKGTSKKEVTNLLDLIFLNKYLGIPIFLFVMYLLFWTTINIGSKFIDFFDIIFGEVFVEGVGSILTSINAPHWLILILAEGIGAGIQTVATFIPVISIMFIMLSILEDSGYMSRAAFLMDRFMRFLGLPGKAFVPLIIGFGCTVPAIMATRTLENEKDRLITVFMAPLMSCGARLPVYALFVSAFFAKSGGVIVFLIYMIGIVLAILTGILLKKTLFKGEVSHFLMELPPYHVPRIKHIAHHTWIKLKSFIIRAGQVIVLSVIILGLMNSISVNKEDTALSYTGKLLTPILEPIGIVESNWPATVSLFTGIFAKEAIVGNLNSMYAQIDGENSESNNKSYNFSLINGLQEAIDSIRINFSSSEEVEIKNDNNKQFVRLRKYFTPIQSFSFLLFVLIYFPCLAALGASVKEVGAKYATISVGYLTLLAWSLSTIFYQIAEGHNILNIAIAIMLLIGIFIFMIWSGKKRKGNHGCINCSKIKK